MDSLGGIASGDPKSVGGVAEAVSIALGSVLDALAGDELPRRLIAGPSSGFLHTLGSPYGIHFSSLRPRYDE